MLFILIVLLSKFLMNPLTKEVLKIKATLEKDFASDSTDQLVVLKPNTGYSVLMIWKLNPFGWERLLKLDHKGLLWIKKLHRLLMKSPLTQRFKILLDLAHLILNSNQATFQMIHLPEAVKETDNGLLFKIGLNVL